MTEVRLFAALRQGREKIYRFPAGNLKTASALPGRPDAPLKDGDVVSLFPPVAGG